MNIIKKKSAVKAAVMLIVVWLPIRLTAGEAPTTAPATRPATEPSGPSVVKLTLHPSATTKPALQYALLPDFQDQTPGNAATLYYIAADLLDSAAGQSLDVFRERVDVPGALPLEELAHDKKTEWILDRYAPALRYVDLAARCEDCQWGSGPREFGLNSRLPYLNQCRFITSTLTLKTRHELARGDLQGARRTIQTTFSLARQLNQRPTLIDGLVANGIAEMALIDDLDDWISLDHSPNLYWALSSLPQPFTNYHGIAETEQSALYFQFPVLRQAAEGKELSAEQWRAIMRFLIDLDVSPPRAATPAPPDVDKRVDRLVASVLPRAREHLRSAGMSREKVEALAPEQAAGVYLFHEYRVVSDEMWNSWELPYLQSIDLLHAADERIGKRESAQAPFLGLLPALWRSKTVFTQLDRHIALLRTVEALRDYLARHGGSLPRGLDQITDVPIPIDPFTDMPFTYRVEGQTGILEALRRQADPHRPAGESK